MACHFRAEIMSSEAKDGGEPSEKAKPETSEASAIGPTTTDVSELVDSGTNKNKKKVVCARCDSVILLINTATHRKYDPAVELPLVRQSKSELVQASGQFQSEKLDNFWLVHDMYAFENVGFTNTVDQKKYLICADCEVGPIGFQSMDVANEFLVSFNRVKHI